jgi:MFS family permease
MAAERPGALPWEATTVFVPPTAGAQINRVGERPLIVAGLSLNAAAMAWIARIAAPYLAYWQLVAPLIVSGSGIAMASPAALSSAMTSVAPRFIGKGSGTFSTLPGAALLAVHVVDRLPLDQPAHRVDEFSPLTSMS